MYVCFLGILFFFFSSRRRHTRYIGDWSSDVCSSDLGEVLDLVKKHVFNNRPLDRDHLIEELGDVEFYLEGIRQCLLVTRETILDGNIDKLTERYNGLTYSDQAANARVAGAATAEVVAEANSEVQVIPVGINEKRGAVAERRASKALYPGRMNHGRRSGD